MDEVLSKELLDQWVKRTKELSVYSLASEADCLSPDSLESPGAKLLADARDAVCRAAADDSIVALEDRYRGDKISLIASPSADGGVITIWTHGLWETFVDLGAYQEDLSDVGMTMIPETLDHLAWAALGIIVERLCYSLCEDLDDYARGLHWQYIDVDGNDVSTQSLYAEDDAVEKRLWCENGDLVECWVRTAPGDEWERQS